MAGLPPRRVGDRTQCASGSAAGSAVGRWPVEVEGVGEGVDRDTTGTGVALADATVALDQLPHLIAHRLECLGRDEDRGIARAAGVLPGRGPRRRDVEPPVVLLAEVSGVVAGQPVEGRLGVLVALEVARVPGVVLRARLPQPALALALFGVVDEPDGLELAQVVARRAGVGAERGREV